LCAIRHCRCSLRDNTPGARAARGRSAWRQGATVYRLPLFHRRLPAALSKERWKMLRTCGLMSPSFAAPAFLANFVDFGLVTFDRLLHFRKRRLTVIAEDCCFHSGE